MLTIHTANPKNSWLDAVWVATHVEWALEKPRDVREGAVSKLSVDAREILLQVFAVLRVQEDAVITNNHKHTPTLELVHASQR